LQGSRVRSVGLRLSELNRAGLEAGDTEKVISYLHRELLEAQDLANTGKQKCLDLQAQLGKLQADMEALREQRESTICSTREELYSAQEEVQLQQQLKSHKFRF
ncbi:hypothetical protein GOODEAATRI_005827, partial [Goodea atripinnis]